MFKLSFLTLLRIFEKKYENRSCSSGKFWITKVVSFKILNPNGYNLRNECRRVKKSKIISPIYCGAEHLIFFDLSSTQRKVVPWGPRMVGQLSAVHNSEMTPKWWSTLWNSAKAWVAIHSYSHWLIFTSRKNWIIK